jgi:fluoroquinolone transport system permease protein
MMGDFVSSEVKKWTRDPFMVFMLVYPLLFAFVGRYLIPYIAEVSDFMLEAYSDIVLVALLLFCPAIYGAVVGFSILDDRDDNIITAVQVTPLDVNRFLSVRLIMATVMTFATALFIIWFTGLVSMSAAQAVTVSLLIGFGTPIVGFLINSLSSNKVEGFAIMKGFGIVSLFPLMSLFFFDLKELLFAFAPGFWPAKMIGIIFRGEGLHYLSYNTYLMVGAAYIAVTTYLVFGVFRRKLNL